MGSRGISEGTQEVSENETIIYELDVTNWGNASDAVSSPTMAVIRLFDGADVTSSVTSGSMSVSGQVITLKALTSLKGGQRYRIDIGFTKGGSTGEVEIFVDCPSRAGTG